MVLAQSREIDAIPVTELSPKISYRRAMICTAGFERGLIRERVKSGPAAAKARGVVLGRRERSQRRLQWHFRTA